MAIQVDARGRNHTTHDMVFHLVVKGHMPGVGGETYEAVTQESTSRDNGTNRERPKKAFVRQRESEREKADKKRRRANIRERCHNIGRR